MELLEKRIMQDGEVYPGNILKVSSFLNHQMDIDLLDEGSGVGPALCRRRRQ